MREVRANTLSSRAATWLASTIRGTRPGGPGWQSTCSSRTWYGQSCLVNLSSVGPVSFAHVNSNFPNSVDGFGLCVVVGLDGKTTAALISAGRAVAVPVLCRGLIDTGTDISCVASRVLRQLGLLNPTAQATT